MLFKPICRQVAKEVGGNTLIPSPSIDESKRLLPLNVVTMKMKRKYIFIPVMEYSPYNISLTNFLIDKPVLNIQSKKSPCCMINHSEGTSSMYLKIGANVKDLIGANVNASDKVAVTLKLGHLFLEEIPYPSFVSALKGRKLDMNNHFIKETIKDKRVLCVVSGVITSSDKAEIKRIDSTNVNMKLFKKGPIKTNVDAGYALNSVQDMVIEAGTTLAYKVWKLKVDVNGVIDPVLTPKKNGGFSPKKIAQKKRKLEDSPETETVHKKARGWPSIKEIAQTKKKLQYSSETGTLQRKATECPPIKAKDDPLKNLKGILQPLRDCTEADGQHFKSSVLVLMTYSRDVFALSKILSKAEHGCLNEDKDTFDKQFINNDKAWSILKFVGVQTEEGRILFEREPTPILMAVAYVIDAIVELEHHNLEKICKFNEPQLNTLSKIFESAITSIKTIFMDVDMSSALTESVSSFLTDLDFTVFKDDKRILPPKAKTSIAECIFCVLYCLSS